MGDDSDLPLAAVERLIRRADSNMRVSEEAAAALREVLEERAVKIAQQAVEMAKHANRKTVTAPDIKLAVKNA